MLISPELDMQLKKAAERQRLSKGEFVRRALIDTLKRGRSANNALAQLATLNGPTGDIEQMLSEIEAGRG